jgi:hypothetical protein
VDQALQKKVTLLGGLFVAFILMAGPVFVQVKADTLDSAKEVPNTVLSKAFKSFMKSLDIDRNSLSVEDAWFKEQKNKDPNCGVECDPDGDLDGDGMSNSEELKRGRNPACNENEYGEAYCKGADQHNVTPPPDPNGTKGVVRELANWTWLGQNDSAVFRTNVNQISFTTQDKKWDRFLVFVNATVDGYGYRMVMRDEPGSALWTVGRQGDGVPRSPSKEPMQQTTLSSPENGTYRFEFTFDSSGAPPVAGESRTSVHVVVVGIIEPTKAS